LSHPFVPEKHGKITEEHSWRTHRFSSQFKSWIHGAIISKSPENPGGKVDTKSGIQDNYSNTSWIHGSTTPSDVIRTKYTSLIHGAVMSRISENPLSNGATKSHVEDINTRRKSWIDVTTEKSDEITTHMKSWINSAFSSNSYEINMATESVAEDVTTRSKFWFHRTTGNSDAYGTHLKPWMHGASTSQRSENHRRYLSFETGKEDVNSRRKSWIHGTSNSLDVYGMHGKSWIHGTIISRSFENPINYVVTESGVKDIKNRSKTWIHMTNTDSDAISSHMKGRKHETDRIEQPWMQSSNIQKESKMQWREKISKLWNPGTTSLQKPWTFERNGRPVYGVQELFTAGKPRTHHIKEVYKSWIQEVRGHTAEYGRHSTSTKASSDIYEMSSNEMSYLHGKVLTS